MKQLILSSSSPRRRELLLQAGLTFEVLVPFCEEKADLLLSPEQYVQELSRIKCLAGAKVAGTCYVDGVVIGADTIVCHRGCILGKPADEEDAFRMLKSLSGEVHQVYTGVTVFDLQSTQTDTFYEKTEVAFYDLSDHEILSYIRTGEPFDKAGAYGIQGRGACLVKGINGDYCNVVGLPIAHLIRVLYKYDTDQTLR